jgi:ribonuclease BN (tRNA processing enzyme)
VSTVRLHFLGSGDAFHSGGRLHACLLLEGGGEPLVLDFGATGLLALRRAEIEPVCVGWVALSHLHGDHIGGLPYLIVEAKAAGRIKPLMIAGPPRTEERLQTALDALYPGNDISGLPFEVAYATLEPPMSCSFGPAIITPFPAHHESGAPACSLRIDYGGKVIAYSGDTGWSDDLVETAKEADLLVCECNFFDQQMPSHIDYRTLDANRSRLGCDRIVLTHMGEEMLAHLDEVDLEAASDGMTITV